MPDFVPVCLFCLESINEYLRDGYLNENDSKAVTNLFRQFVSFSKAFLRMEHVDQSLNPSERFLSGSPIKRQLFCGTCREKLTEILDLYEKLTVLECKLGWKVGDLGEIIKKSETPIDDQDFPIKKLGVLATQMQVKKYLHVELFRKEVARKCDLKARKVLPTVMLTRGDGVVSENSIPIQVEVRAEEVQLVVSLIIVYYLVRGSVWELPKLLESLETNKNINQAFVTFGYGSGKVTVPTRSTLLVFTRIILIYSLACDWNLEEIMMHYEIKPLQIKIPFASQIKIKELNRRLQTKLATGQIAQNILNSERSSSNFAEKSSSTFIKNKYLEPLDSKESITSIEKNDKLNVPSIQLTRTSPGRPPGRKKGKRGRPPAIKTILKSEFPTLKKKVGRPKKIKVDFPAAVEKIEVDIPSPEPSLVADGFDEGYPSDPPSPEDIESNETQNIKDNQTEDTPPSQSKQFTLEEDNVEQEETKAGSRRWQFRHRSKNKLSKKTEDDDTNPKLEMPNKKRYKKRKRVANIFAIPSVPTKRQLRGIPAHHHNVKKSKTVDNENNSEGNDPVKKKRLEDIDCYSAAHGFLLKCSHCPASFFRLFSYQDHLRMEHGKESKSYYCSPCNKEYDSQFSLRLHLQVKYEKADEKSHFCIYCSESFTTLQCCELHRRNLHWIHPQELFCDKDDCQEKFSSTSDLKEHHKSHCAPSNESPESSSEEVSKSLQIFTCDKCDWSFLSEYRLQLHKFNHYEKKGWYYHCCSCSRRFRSTFALMHHFNLVHAQKDKLELFRCDVDDACDFCFVNQKYLDDHKKTHELHERKIAKFSCPPVGGLEKVLPCVYCSHEFNVMSLRTAHEKICHKGPSQEKRRAASSKYLCGKCDYSSVERGRLERHQYSHMEAMFECPHCDGKFHREEAVESHVIRMHTKTSQFVCHICGRVCPHKWELTFHLKEHEALHMCQICGQRFSRGWLLRDHMRKHNGERFQCEWCPKNFSTVSLIKGHVRKFHPEEFEKRYKRFGRTKMRYRAVTVTVGGGENTTRLEMEGPGRQNLEINIPLDNIPENGGVVGENNDNCIAEQNNEYSMLNDIVLQPL